MRFVAMMAAICLSLAAASTVAAEFAVSIRSDFPGGNVVVGKNDGAVVEVAPDLRGGQKWFYWHFEARASQPGRATFVFNGPTIGVRGPAVSVDAGRSWSWLGADHVTYVVPRSNDAAGKFESFRYDFTAEHLAVRFAVAIPYLDENLQTFLRRHADNPALKKHVLARTRNGTPVEMLEIGAPGPGIEPMLVTARHHACESTASYVLEGFLEEAMSNSAAGVAFRKKHVLFAIPLVDKDGVQAGDQGKNRSPHDHNRDYGDAPLYPEIAAIQNLAEAQDVHYAFDFHCPALRGDIHEAFHFLGLGVPHISENLNEFIAWIKEERPQGVMAPLNVLKDSAKPGAEDPRIFSHRFATRPGSLFAATLEVPYTQPNVPLNADMARSYGRSLLRAWNRTKFLPAEAAATDNSLQLRGDEANVALSDFRKQFLSLYRSKPAEVEALAAAYLDDDEARDVFRVEAHNLLAVLRLHQRRYAEATEHSDAAANDEQATTYQRTVALLLRLQATAADPASTPEQVDARLREFEALPYPARESSAKAREYAGAYYEAKQGFQQAIDHARRQLQFAATYEEGKVLNRIAALHDRLNQPELATAARQEVVTRLKPRVTPTAQRSVFGAMMVVDYFDAVYALPTSTLDEKRAAGELVLRHDIVSADSKAKVQTKLAELGEP